MEVVPFKNYAAVITRVVPDQINHVSSIKRSPAEIEAVYKETIKKSRKSIESCITHDTDYVVESEEQSLIVIPIILDSQGTLVETTALIDSGSSGSFISSSLVKQHQLHSVKTNGTTYRLADSSEHVTFGASTLLLNIRDIDHGEVLTLRHLQTCAYPVILGQNWLQRHNPAMSWRDGIIAFTCLCRCCKENKEKNPVHAPIIEKQQPQLSAFVPPILIPFLAMILIM
ncbi:hypothetical protein INT47_002993 [Mucor saturninus]|uniref:Uncharacterized protein n=1 Tax=Mucor saturninus TaxID=64648 RepID=A0A8H7QSN1_9FUNG|nr:hypothetical protein INT47_002993 [Mucor saturninus]